jgi:ABC-2 type transport system permease protein
MAMNADAGEAVGGLGPLRIPGWDGFDPRRTRGRPIADAWRSFRTAARLGWAMEANWTDPLLFLIYSVAKPVSAALILVAMLTVVGGASNRQYLGFVVAGSALWSFVGSSLTGLSWSVLDDRERYQMLRYVYVTPSDFLVVLLGRGVARVAVGAMGAGITLALGVLVLGVTFDPFRVDWPLLIVSTALGLGAIVAIGVMLAAVCLQTRQDSWSYPEAVAGALFLVSGAVFPLAVLPEALQGLGLVTPIAWWLEGTRRALLGATSSAVGGQGSAWLAVTGTVAPTALEIVGALMLTGTVGTLAAMLAFRASVGRAKDRGLLDQTTGS